MEPVIILDADRLRTYFEEIKSGFYQTPRETLISTIVIILLILVPVILFLIFQKRKRKTAVLETREKFEEEIKKKDIDEEERKILERMIVHAPQGLEPIGFEGWGEVQTPLSRVREAPPLEVGDPVICRHAKAGELAERFAEYLLVRGDRVAERVPTYRGLGWTF